MQSEPLVSCICVTANRRKMVGLSFLPEIPFMLIKVKACSVCKAVKPVSEFYIKQGRRIAMCRRCAVVQSVAWMKANKEKRQTISRRWLAANKDRHNEQARAWSKRHPERKHASERSWLEHNPLKRKDVARAYVQRNLDKANALYHKRRARLHGNGGSHTSDDIKELYRKQFGRCANPACAIALCAGYEVDHIQPISRGGSDYSYNLQLLCKSCNRKKHAKSPERWARENGVAF